MFICSKSLKSSKCLKRSKSKDGSTKRSPIGILVLLSWRLHPNRWCEIAAYKTHVQTDRGNKNLRANKIVITIMMMVASSLSVGRLRFTIECSLIRTMSTTSFLNMCLFRPLLRLFLYFSHHYSITNWKSLDGVLGICTLSRRMVGADKTTELWRPPFKNKF